MKVVITGAKQERNKRDAHLRIDSWLTTSKLCDFNSESLAQFDTNKPATKRAELLECRQDFGRRARALD